MWVVIVVLFGDIVWWVYVLCVVLWCVWRDWRYCCVVFCSVLVVWRLLLFSCYSVFLLSVFVYFCVWRLVVLGWSWGWNCFWIVVLDFFGIGCWCRVVLFCIYFCKLLGVRDCVWWLGLVCCCLVVFWWYVWLWLFWWIGWCRMYFDIWLVRLFDVWVAVLVIVVDVLLLVGLVL